MHPYLCSIFEAMVPHTCSLPEGTHSELNYVFDETNTTSVERKTRQAAAWLPQTIANILWAA